MIAIYCIIKGQKYNLTSLCESVTISGAITNVCRQADITIAHGTFTKNLPGLTIPDYTPVWVRDEYTDGSLKEGLISGISVDFSKNNEKYTLTVFDFAYYLKRSKITRNISNSSAEQEVQDICNELGIEVNYLYPTKILIENRLIAQQNAYNTLMGLYTEVKKQTGELFYLSTNYYNKIGIYKVGNHLCEKLICACSGHKNIADGNLIIIEYKVTGSNLVNKVNVYDSDNKLIDTITDYKNYPTEHYGTLQDEYVQEEDKDYKTVVKASVLHGIDKDFTVEILGDYTFYAGSSVKIYAPWLCSDLDKNSDGSYRTAYIRSDSHTWDLTTSAYITKLELTLNAEMDEKELQDATKKEESTSTGSSNSVSGNGNKVVEYARQFIGTPYVYGGNSLSSGCDCSGMVQQVYAHFGVDLPRTTYEQVNFGTAVSKNELQPGDLVFPSDHHVQIYSGDGKIVEQPKSGLSEREVPMWGFWKARRVI